MLESAEGFGLKGVRLELLSFCVSITEQNGRPIFLGIGLNVLSGLCT